MLTRGSAGRPSGAAYSRRSTRMKELPTQQRTYTQGFTEPDVPNYTPSRSSTPAPDLSQYRSSNSPVSGRDLNDWVDSMRVSAPEPFDAGKAGDVSDLREQLLPSSGPNMPAPVDLNDYQTQMATINDISKKYGFDYSREYAEQQAEVIAQAQRDEIATSRERQEYETDQAREDLQHDFFQQFRQQRQDLVDSGLNAGIAAERDTRLDMNRQNALGEILAQQQLYNQELDRRLSTISKEEAAYADQLYNERLQQGFQNSMDVSQFMQSENQFQAQMEMQQRNQLADEQWREYEFNNMSAAEREQLLQSERQFGTEMAWREYEFNNMSASERQQLAAEAERFGLEQAWQRHEFDAQLAFEAGYNSGNISGGNWTSSKGEPPDSFKQDLSAALNKTGMPTSWIQPMTQLVANESTWNPTAQNPNSSAYGYGQFIDSTRRAYEDKYNMSYDDPVNQLSLMLHYVNDRYGGAPQALEFWNRNNYY